MSIRLGIIGCGAIGALHADAAQQAGSSVVGCCDLDPVKASSFATRLGGCTPYTELDGLLSRSDLDAVVVCVPNVAHRSIALEAITAGKDVLLEKPIALNLAEGRQIAVAADEHQRIVQINFVCRESPTSRQVRRMIDAGRLGRIVHAKAILHRRRGIPGLGRWFTTRAQSGGGVLIDLGVHLIDLVRDLLGRPTAVRVSGTCSSTFGAPLIDYTYEEMWAGPPNHEGTFDVEDAATALIRFDNGVALDLSVSWASNLPEGLIPNGIYLDGDRAGVFFDIWGTRIEMGTEQDGALLDVTPRCAAQDPWLDGWRRQHATFANHVRERTVPGASLDEGLAAQAILDAIYQSADRGAEVAIESI